MKGMKMIVLLVMAVLLLEVTVDYSRAADTKQKEKTKVKFVPREVKMDSNLRKRLNTFFSNFSEVGVKPFVRDKIDNKELVNFGVMHNYINRFDRFEHVKPAGDFNLKLKASYVEAAVEKYFGRKLTKHESVPPDIRYKDGYYYIPGVIPGLTGEAPVFSQIIKLVEIGDNLFVATVDVYTACHMWEGDPHGTPEEWRKNADRYGEPPERIARMTATIKKIRSDKGERYILIEYLKANDTKQKEKAVKSLSTEPKKQSQQPKEVVPLLPNGISIGGISIGITEFTREKNVALVRFVFKCINEDDFPRRFSVLLTDDRGNEYKGEVNHYPFLAMPSVGSTWITDSPVIIKIPKIAPISKFELIPETGGRFNLDYRKLTPLPPLSLKFKINPEQVLTGKEIRQDKNISIWFGEVKMEETEQIEDKWEKRVKKTISLKVPVTIENRDYNPRTMEMPLELKFQLNSGRILSETEWRQPFSIHSRTVDGASKQSYEETFKVEVEKDEYVQLISVYRVPKIPFPGVFAVEGDLSPKLLGFLYISERAVTPSEIAFTDLPPRKPLPPHIEDGDWFPDGSKIVVSEKTEKIKKGFWGEEVKETKRRIFIMNPDGTDKKEVSFKGDIDIDYLDHVAPLVSPDGKKIAFVVSRYDKSASIYVIDVDGSNIRKGAFGDSVAYAWISNDEIVFWRSYKSYTTTPDTDIFYTNGEIYIIDINTMVIERRLKTLPPVLLKGKFVSSSVISGLVIKDFQK